MALGKRKKPLNYDDNLDHVMFREGSRSQLDMGAAILREGRLCYPAFNSNNFATSAALAEVCAVLSAILVITVCTICAGCRVARSLQLPRDLVIACSNVDRAESVRRWATRTTPRSRASKRTTSTRDGVRTKTTAGDTPTNAVRRSSCPSVRLSVCLSVGRRSGSIGD